jgi:putative RNA 2'-phosphotransferase
MDAELRRLSRFLSFVLRHHPERIGLRLDGGGWAEVADLVDRASAAGVGLTAETLAEVVATNDKQRFTFDVTGTRIRASQGHSITVDLDLVATPAPGRLYHGTGERAVESILAQGLTPQGRHHVHLSPDVVAAVAVGRRHGRPAVFEVDSGRMQADGQVFYRSANGVWLAELVAPRYLRLISSVEGA